MKFQLIFITYLIAILKNFTALHVGSLLIKIKSTVKLGVLISPILMATEKVTANVATWMNVNVWVIDNSSYIQIVMGAIIVDHALGSIKHLFWMRDFQFQKNITGLTIKIGLVVAVGFLFEGLNELVHQDTIIKQYLTMTTRIVVFLYPAGSAFSNSSVISGGKFPPIGWMEKLRQFQTNLNPQDLHPNNNPNNNHHESN